MNIELTQDEADLLRTLMESHVAMSGMGLMASVIAGKLDDAGAKLGSLKWHVNSFNHIAIDSFYN